MIEFQPAVRTMPKKRELKRVSNLKQFVTGSVAKKRKVAHGHDGGGVTCDSEVGECVDDEDQEDANDSGYDTDEEEDMSGASAGGNSGGSGESGALISQLDESVHRTKQLSRADPCVVDSLVHLSEVEKCRGVAELTYFANCDVVRLGEHFNLKDGIWFSRDCAGTYFLSFCLLSFFAFVLSCLLSNFSLFLDVSVHNSGCCATRY